MAGAGITVRPFRAEDAEAIVELHARSFAGLAGTHNSQDQIDAHVALIRDPSYGRELTGNNLLVGVTADGEIVATAGWCDLEGEPETARIRKVFVSPRSAGAGVGRRLVGEAEANARRRGRRRYFVRANLNAAGFYERLGYRAVREGLMPVPGGVMLPVVFMRKP